MLSYCLLPRSIVEISGKDSLSFIQGLITQDINLLKSNSSIFTLLLTNTGRYFLDFFIIKSNNALLIDIATSDVDLLINIINHYKLRSNINIVVNNSLQIFSIFSSTENTPQFNTSSLSNTQLNNSIIIADNRNLNLGLRVITSNQKLFTEIMFLNTVKDYFNLPNIPNLSLVSAKYYTIQRYLLAVPENTELIKEKSIPLECNFDNFNAISFNKGCYLGQEFTNSSKRILVIRKMIISFTTDAPTMLLQSLTKNTVIKNQENIKVGNLLSVYDNYLMALINIENINNKNRFFINNTEITPILPSWFKQNY